MWEKTRLGKVVHSILWLLLENLVDFVGTMEEVGEWVFSELKRSPENKQKKKLLRTIEYKIIPLDCGNPWGILCP